MFKFLCFIMIFPILLCSGANVMCDLFSEASSVEIYNNGQILELTESEQKKFDELFCSAITDARQMPAFGVSLHDDTIEAMQNGFWIKFIFDGKMIKSEMPFDELLINVQQDCHGLNVIRGNDGVYEGRCYYLDLKSTLNEVYDFLLTLNFEEKPEIELEAQEVQETIIVNEEQEGDKENDSENEEDGEHKNIVIKQEPLPQEQTELNKSQQELLNHLS